MSMIEVGLLISFAIMILGFVLGFAGLGPLIAEKLRSKKKK